MKSPAALLAAFTAGAMTSLAASVFLVGSMLGSFPAVRAIHTPVLLSVGLSVMLLGLSQLLLRREGASLAVLGLMPTGVRFRDFRTGFAVSSMLFLGVAEAQTAAVGAEWELQGLSGIRVALLGLLSSGVLVLAEELLFRGLALRYLRELYGNRTAILLSALLFGAYHLLQSGDWAMGAVYRFLMPTVGGLLFGWAALRSQGLALPLGLHLGGNWVQSSLAGFASSNIASPTTANALWRISIGPDDVRTLTAPDLIPHLPYLAAVALAATVTWRLLRGSDIHHRTA